MEYSYYKEHPLKNGKVLIVRNLMPDDAQKMIGLIRTADTQTRFLAREPGEFRYSEDQERDLIANRNKEPYTFWIAGEIDAQIVANCDTCRVSGKQRYLHRACLGIVVLQEYWRLGIGRILIQDSIQWCKEKGFEQLELDVLTTNDAAIALYRSVGFEVFGTKKNALKYPDGTYADEYIMWRSLQ